MIWNSKYSTETKLLRLICFYGLYFGGWQGDFCRIVGVIKFKGRVCLPTDLFDFVKKILQFSIGILFSQSWGENLLMEIFYWEKIWFILQMRFYSNVTKNIFHFLYYFWCPFFFFLMMLKRQTGICIYRGKYSFYNEYTAPSSSN